MLKGSNGIAALTFYAVSIAPPMVVTNVTVATKQDQAVSIAIAKLLMLASNPVGGPLTLSAVSATSTNGGQVVLSASAITYAPPASYVGADCFTYTVTNGMGGTASAYVFVSVTSGTGLSANMLPPTYLPGAVAISFAGIVGRTYSLQRAPSVTGPWTTLGAVTVGPSGIGSLQDTNPLPGNAFYRTTWP